MKMSTNTPNSIIKTKRDLSTFFFKTLTIGSDTPCNATGGVCQYVHLPCRGRYISGLCSGGTRQRCCLTTSSDTGTFSFGKDI